MLCVVIDVALIEIAGNKFKDINSYSKRILKNERFANLNINTTFFTGNCDLNS